MTEELPAGWVRTTIGELGRYVNGRGFKKNEWSEEGIPIIRIQNLTGSSEKFNYFSGDLDSRHVVETGDLLLSWAATLGVYEWHGPRAALNQHIFKVESFINKRFHRYLLETLIDQLYRASHGSGMVHITRGKFESLVVDIPPLNEQQRIVSVLEAELSRIDSSIGLLNRSAGRLKKTRSSWLRACSIGGPVSQRGFIELESAGVTDGPLPKLPSGWEWRRLHEIAEVASGVAKDSSKQSGPGLVEVPYLRVANVKKGFLDLSQVKKIRVSEKKAEQLRLQSGDVLLNEGGDRDKLGRGWIWEGQIPGCIHQNHVFRVRINPGELHPKLLSWHANEFGQGWCHVNGKQSVNLASISLSKIKLLPVPVPPLAEQHLLVKRVQEGLDSFDRIAGQLGLVRAKAISLRRALLVSAFAGKLVPQDLADEPASVLIERIRAEQAKAPRVKRGRKSKEPSSSKNLAPIPEDSRPVPAGEQTALEI